MRDINLIPPDILSARRTRKRFRFWIALNLGVVGILALSVAAAFWGVRSVKATAGELDDRMSELHDRTEELDRLRAERELLGEEERALASLVDRDPDHALIRSIAGSIAGQGWLSRLEMTRSVGRGNGEDESGFLRIEGHAGSYTHLAALMGAVDSLEWVTGVELIRSQQAQAEGLDVISFELECVLWSHVGDRR